MRQASKQDQCRYIYQTYQGYLGYNCYQGCALCVYPTYIHLPNLFDKLVVECGTYILKTDRTASQGQGIR